MSINGYQHKPAYKNQQPDIQVDIKAWLRKIIQYWWIFVLGILITVPAGQVYLKYAEYKYSATAKIQIKGAGNSSNLSAAGILAEGLGMRSDGTNLDDEIQILTSRHSVLRTVQRIGAGVAHFRTGRVKDTELYMDSPLFLDKYLLNDGHKQFSFYVQLIDDRQFLFKVNRDDIGAKWSFDQPFSNEFGEFLIKRNISKRKDKAVYHIKIMDVDHVTLYYKSRLEVEIVGSQNSSSILQIKLEDRSAQKAEDFINTLIDVYNEAEINDDTQILKNTIQFIDERISKLMIELDNLEGEIEKYKREHSIINESASASLGFALSEMRTSVGHLSELEVEQRILKSLGTALRDEAHNLIPINISGANAALGTLINQYNTLFLRHKKLSETATTESPLIMDLRTKMSDLRNLILISLENLQHDLDIPIANARNEIDRLQQKLMSIPAIEQQLLEQMRMQSIKENLYLFLLQKREDTQLSQAVTTSKTRVIESGRKSGGAVFPQSKLILMASILLGLFLPLLVVVVILLFQTKIDSEEVLTSLTSIPILGRIAHNKSEKHIIVNKNDRSASLEMFRLLRTNLNYMNPDTIKKIVLVTSSVAGEGKSTVAMNLGMTIALSNRRVVLLGMDLRKPKVSEYIGTSNGKGISNYLAGQCELKDILHQYDSIDHFYYVTSGPVPPNPAELIESDRMKDLIEALKKDFDYIIIDSPPVGIVADALLFRNYITNTLYVVRHKYTKKEMIKYLEEMHVTGELIKPSIILNDINISGSNGYGGYSKTYGAGYYVNDN